MPPKVPQARRPESWQAIERCLAAASRAADLREQSRLLCEASRLIREECARVSRRNYKANRKADAARSG